MPKLLLKDRVVIIAGAAGLLGSELATAAAAEGARVVLADISAVTKGLASELNKKYGSGTAISLPINITSIKSIRKLICTVGEKFGRIDSLVNSAYPRNKNYGRKFEAVEYKDFCENVNLHLGGYFLVSQQFAEFFKNHGGGSVINISSVYGVVPPRFEIYNGTPMTMPVEYAAIKSALLMLAKYMAKYYANANIRFNTVSIGGIENGQPESFLKAYRKLCLNKGMLGRGDVSGTIIYLLSDMAKYVNGQNIVIDDGFTL